MTFRTTLVAAAISVAAVQSVQAKDITVGTILNSNDVAIQAMQKWDDLLTERTEGRLSLNIIAGGALGGTRELVQQLASGEIDVNLSAPVALQEAAPTYQCLEAEYVFRDEDHGFAVWRGDIGKATSTRMREDYGIEIAAVGRRGSRNVTANVPVKTPKDLTGVKMRVTNSLRSEVFSAFGALPPRLRCRTIWRSASRCV
ncbi:2,3-diketo-L-gulonate-binding periplasmic protein YiaO (plasmid) [Sulfitobacter indolifex]|uniref:Solute-binding transport protein n=1 Tax=Sulfitobacter indolifex HEL-45 TaxID=391624 RepID=A0ABM9X1F3_9RHOB|nr:TRAP transporter substrate-binding protein DctP [Sulfitobacter indolifex]EDQ03078.1 putative solute-binding transport protein [Sulfitobacter indolifex HEL-45]UOA21247.1 2,3-diketo-L-gulonate-binding periplasmic protein YiaO [Sulfitobacter indolifex]